MASQTANPAPIEIVQAGIEHVDEVSRLFDLYRQFYDQPPDGEGARRFIRARLLREESVIFLALASGHAIGFTQLYPSFSSVSMQRLWVLNDLYVAAGARKSGAGRALLDRARQFAVETGAKGLELATANDNLAAQSLYDKTGWVRDRNFIHYFLKC